MTDRSTIAAAAWTALVVVLSEWRYITNNPLPTTAFFIIGVLGFLGWAA